MRPALRSLLLTCLLAAAGCGGENADPADAGTWQHARIEGLQAARGLSVHDEELLVVCGGGDRDIYAVRRSGLEPGATVRARALVVDITPESALQGTERLGMQGYTMKHLWQADLDFQAIATQAPDFVYVGERRHRIVFWGRLYRDTAGTLARVQLARMTILPGARREGEQIGDWTDHGPGLSGLVAVERTGRTEYLYALDRGEAKAPIRIWRLDRYGSNLGGIRARHAYEVDPEASALSFDQDRLLLLLGRGRGRIVTLRTPEKLDSVALGDGVPGPEVEGVEQWTGMAHAADGTIYLVSGGWPAVVAWRRR